MIKHTPMRRIFKSNFPSFSFNRGCLATVIARERSDRGNLGFDDNNEIAMKYSIMSIPTLKFFKGGNMVGEIVGAAPKQTIVAALTPHLAA